MAHTTYPHITAVKPLADKRLLADFDNGVSKIYDCTPLVEQEPSRALADHQE